MSKPLNPISVAAPGFYGLNTQSAGRPIPAVWASQMTNFIFDDVGRPASRKGTVRLNSTAISGEPRIDQIYEYVDGGGNTLEIFSAGDKIYKNVSGTFTDITGTATTPTASNWKFQNFNGNCVGFQRGHAPIVITSTGGSFADIALSGTQQPTTAANTVLAAYGRLWVLDGSDLKYSDLLSYSAFNGVFDLHTYWKDGVDEGVALADWNGYLIVFGKRSIIVFSAPYDPASTMQIVENIGGFGCIARDSIQTVGKDIFFLSKSGIRSLGRTVQEKSNPIGDITKNVRDSLVNAVEAEDVDDIRSTYSEKNGFYVLCLPSSRKTFCIDTRFQLEDGTYRVTDWDYSPDSIHTLLDGSVHISRTKAGASRYGSAKFGLSRYSFGTGTGGYLSNYSGYLDEVSSTNTGGDSYSIKYYSSWQDFSEQGAGSVIKIPKKLSFLLGGARGDTVYLKWGNNFESNGKIVGVTRSLGTVAQYGVSQFGVGTYSGFVSFSESKSPMSGSGRVIRFGMEAQINGYSVSIQDATLFAKTGRLAA